MSGRGTPGTGSWASSQTKCGGAEGSAQAKLATDIDEALPETGKNLDCDRPYAWCELHHEDPWGGGGHTDLHLAVPPCGYHHRRMHDPRFVTQISTDDSGVKAVRLRER
ncbi:MAG: hypothetical protein ABR500_06020 [Dermatophilaceae bacterium]|nr:hypothetical protein [Intrasporangiaceae bacterium]